MVGRLPGIGIMGINYLIGFQALMNLPYLPAQFGDFVKGMVVTFGLSNSQVAAIFFMVGSLAGYVAANV
jgi:hypothetical protein